MYTFCRCNQRYERAERERERERERESGGGGGGGEGAVGLFLDTGFKEELYLFLHPVPRVHTQIAEAESKSSVHR